MGSLERLFWFHAADSLSVSADMKPFMTQKWNLSLIFLLSAFYLELAMLFIWWRVVLVERNVVYH